VIRHVKPSSTEKTGRGIPAPSTGARRHDEILNRLTREIATQMGFTLDDRNEWLEIHQTLSEYPEKMVSRLNDAFKPRTQLATAIALLVYRAESEEFIREFAAFGGVIPDESNGMDLAMAYVRSLHHYPQLPQMDDYSTADETTKQVCRELMLLTHRMEDEIVLFDGGVDPVRTIQHDYDSYNTPVLNHDGLVRLIMERPQDAQRIGDIAIERGTGDPRAIVEVMDHEVSSLSGGVL
jgi:hypothetical protein